VQWRVGEEERECPLGFFTDNRVSEVTSCTMFRSFSVIFNRNGQVEGTMVKREKVVFISVYNLQQLNSNTLPMELYHKYWFGVILKTVF